MNSYADAQAKIQDRIVRFISEELGIAAQEIDPDTNLGTYGVDSVAASKMIGALEREYNLELSTVFVFEFPTIASLAREIAKLVPVREDENAR
jgi:acyl carrier protein